MLYYVTFIIFMLYLYYMYIIVVLYYNLLYAAAILNLTYYSSIAYSIVAIFLGTAHLHGFGLIHRDLKLENLLLDADGGVRICDFGYMHICICIHVYTYI